MTEKSFEFSQANLILVEGKDDKYVFEQLLSAASIPGVQVHAVDTTSQFEPFLRNIRKRVEDFDTLRTISLIRDADDSREGSLEALRAALRSNQLPVPSRSGEFAEGPPSILIECVPLARDAGALEDLVLDAIESANGPHPCWQDLRRCMEATLPNAKDFNEARWNKIRLQLVLNCSLRGYKTGILFALRSREYESLLTSTSFDPLRELLRKIQAEHLRLQALTRK